MNTLKNDWWRIQEEQGIELMLRVNVMSRKDVNIVEFPYPDDWYNDPEMVGPPMENPSELWLRRDHKHDLAFRPLETALLAGKVDAIYTQSKPFQHLQEATGKLKAIEDLSRYPDWTLQVANIPAAITCTDVMAEEHPELVVAFMKGIIKDFMLSHGYIKNDFDVQKWAAPEFIETAAKELLEDQWRKQTESKLPSATELLSTSPRMG